MLFTERDYYKVVIFIVESNGLLTVNVIYTERLLESCDFHRGKQWLTDSKCYLQRKTIIKL